jgi:integrase
MAPLAQRERRPRVPRLSFLVVNWVIGDRIGSSAKVGGPFCSRWFLHKFRHTYATRHLQDAIDIRTLQQWMGHCDLASTMVYLKGARNRDVQARINAGSLASFA